MNLINKQPQLLVMEEENDDEAVEKENTEEEGKPEITMYAFEGVDTTSTIRV